MGRPRKYRKVCKKPGCTQFAPKGSDDITDIVVMSVDEYEVLRLIDFNSMTQEECARQMNIARTTVQKMYDEARFKIAKFIVEGSSLRIEGGEIEYCDKTECMSSGGRPCSCMKELKK